MNRREQELLRDARREAYRLKVLAHTLASEVQRTLDDRRRHGTYNMPGLRSAMREVRQHRAKHGALKPRFMEGRFL